MTVTAVTRAMRRMSRVRVGPAFGRGEIGIETEEGEFL
jgi:hypothetical protein